MKLLDTSYLVDYEKGRDVAHRYFEAHEHDPLAISAVSGFELAFGVARSSTDELATLLESLSWAELVEFSLEDGFAGARIQAELESKGERIPIADSMIAGVARNRGATLVTGDEHFESVDGLDVENYRVEFG